MQAELKPVLAKSSDALGKVDLAFEVIKGFGIKEDVCAVNDFTWEIRAVL